jgi:hypothetical protein
MTKIIPAIDEDMGENGVPEFWLEFRPKGQKHRRWRLGGAGPLTVYRGKPTKVSIEEAKSITVDCETLYGPRHHSGKIPNLEFRIVEKIFVVHRKLVSERSL